MVFGKSIEKLSNDTAKSDPCAWVSRKEAIELGQGILASSSMRCSSFRVCGGVSVGGWVCTWVCVSEGFSNTTSSESMILRAWKVQINFSLLNVQYNTRPLTSSCSEQRWDVKWCNYCVNLPWSISNLSPMVLHAIAINSLTHQLHLHGCVSLVCCSTVYGKQTFAHVSQETFYITSQRHL